MPKNTLLKSCLCILMVIFILKLSLQAHAEQSCDGVNIISTHTGDRKYPPGWQCVCSPYVPVEFDPNNPEEISPGGSVEIAILDGCPPFAWSNPGNGYSWAYGEDIPGVPGGKKTNVRSNQLECETGT